MKNVIELQNFSCLVDIVLFKKNYYYYVLLLEINHTFYGYELKYQDTSTSKIKLSKKVLNAKKKKCLVLTLLISKFFKKISFKITYN